MEVSEVPVQVLLEHIGSAGGAVDALPSTPLFGDHKGSVKFLDCTFLAAF